MNTYSTTYPPNTTTQTSHLTQDFENSSFGRSFQKAQMSMDPSIFYDLNEKILIRDENIPPKRSIEGSEIDTDSLISDHLLGEKILMRDENISSVRFSEENGIDTDSPIFYPLNKNLLNKKGLMQEENIPSEQFPKKTEIGIDSPPSYSLTNEVVLASKFFIAGSDAFSVSKRGTEIIQSLPDTEIEIIDSNASHVAEVIRELQCVCEALRTISFYATPKWIWYRHVTFLGDPSINHSEDVLNGIGTLQHLLETIPDVGFLLTAGTVDKRLKMIKWFLENCHAEIFEAPKKAECERYVFDTVRSESKNITPQALQQLLQYTSNDLMEIDQELQKLLLYMADQKTIDVQDVDSIVVDRKGGDFFEMIDSFFGNDDRQFFRNIRCYFRDQNEGRSLLAALQNRVRLFMALGYFHENDNITHIDKSTLERLKAKYADIWKEGSIFAQNPWYLGKLLATAKRCPVANWIQFQVQLLGIILELSRNPTQQQWLFERLYCQLKLVMHPP